MAKVWNKIDTGLANIHADFLVLREGGQIQGSVTPVLSGEDKLHVSLRFKDPLATAENAGYETIWTDGQSQSTGWIWLKDLEEICELDEVITVQYGTLPEALLDVSVDQINANDLWSVGPGPDFVFTGHTGAGSIVGIIDSGVDIHHEFLWRQTIPTTRTRILRIWDMGLEPVGAETSPPIGLLDPGTPSTYGVQYTAAQIDAVLQGVPEAMPIRHKDCWGHGTHIASIAAGDGRFAFKRVGVAPRAELIIVKILHLQNEPSNAGPDQRFKDAIAYIRNVAAALGKPCVINYSIGSHLGPHDGLTEQENWLAFEFREENAAGAIFVTAAGNDAGKRQHARLDFTAALQDIELPFELYDTRTEFTDNRTCVPKSSTKTLFLDFYYPTGVATVNFEFKPQFANVFTPGPALGSNPVNGTFFARRFRLSHRIQTDHLRERNNFRVQLDPAPIIRHVPGTYVVKIHASAPITMHVWCSQSERQGLRVGNSLPPGVTQEDKFLIGSPAGARNVITVASYDPAPNSDPNLSPTLNVADSSSRGPLARYTSIEPPPKPDIAAPGVGIKAARSRHSGIIPATQTSPRKGTSMAAPHVTGAIALLFEKFPALTPVQARQKLQDKALKDPAPVADEVGGGRLDVKATFNAS